ncbi:MAG: bifunctional riboflavin kinase/FAD synthetase [Endomicrobium sp.]|jgi:riboflavin kinase/FMN adenylyltransferase|nr:bifunctional riboflavin kinase/FAD synthetase [Endomicrobium sp.]
MARKSVITIGTFDGVHKGHTFLINKTIAIAKKNNLKSIAIVLERPFRKVRGLLATCEEKLCEIKSIGVDKIVVIKASSKFLLFTPDEFFDNFLCKVLSISKIVCGVNFAFGKNREGTVKWLEKKAKNKNIEVKIVKPLKSSSEQISSSLIRRLIEKNDIKNATKLLGRNYSFIGFPFKEKGIGKKLGFPTVNLKVDKDKLLPKGVYVSFISQGERTYPSVTSIGSRITFKRGGKIVPETHILNFKDVWKREKTKITIIKKIRDEKKFSGYEDLKKQILQDISFALRFFKKSKINNMNCN